MGTEYDRGRVERFGKRVTPFIRKYLQENGSGAVIGIETAGRLFALEVYMRLLTPGKNDPYVDVIYFEVQKGKVAQALRENRRRVKGRHVIVVDDDIHTQKTYREINQELSAVKDEFEIPSISWAVEYDAPGVANWSANRSPTGFQQTIDTLTAPFREKGKNGGQKEQEEKKAS